MSVFRFATVQGPCIEWALRRNCSVTPAQLGWFYASLCVLSLGIAVLFWLQGATLILPLHRELDPLVERVLQRPVQRHLRPRIVSCPIQHPAQTRQEDRILGEGVLAVGAGADVDATDGVRVSTADGWWLLRASNTQDVLVVRAESDSEAGLYLWATLGENCWVTVERMAQLGIVVGPGEIYGEAGVNFVRFALTATDERIAEGAKRLRDAIGLSDR